MCTYPNLDGQEHQHPTVFLPHFPPNLLASVWSASDTSIGDQCAVRHLFPQGENRDMTSPDQHECLVKQIFLCNKTSTVEFVKRREIDNPRIYIKYLKIRNIVSFMKAI